MAKAAKRDDDVVVAEDVVQRTVYEEAEEPFANMRPHGSRIDLSCCDLPLLPLSLSRRCKPR